MIVPYGFMKKVGGGIPTGNLVYYNRWNGSLTIDQTGNCVTTTSGPLLTNGLYTASANEAVTFDGANDHVNVNANSVFLFGNGSTDSPFSVTVPVYLDTVGINDSILEVALVSPPSLNRQYAIFVGNILGSYYPRIWTFDYTGTTQNGFQGVDSNDAISLSTTYHLAFTYNGVSSFKIYIDGSEVSGYTPQTGGTYTAMNGDSHPITIGSFAHVRGAGVNNFDGVMDGLGIWNIELSAEEVQAIYNKQSSGTEIL